MNHLLILQIILCSGHLNLGRNVNEDYVLLERGDLRFIRLLERVLLLGGYFYLSLSAMGVRFRARIWFRRLRVGVFGVRRSRHTPFDLLSETSRLSFRDLEERSRSLSMLLLIFSLSSYSR